MHPCSPRSPPCQNILPIHAVAGTGAFVCVLNPGPAERGRKELGSDVAAVLSDEGRGKEEAMEQRFAIEFFFVDWERRSCFWKYPGKFLGCYCPFCSGVGLDFECGLFVYSPFSSQIPPRVLMLCGRERRFSCPPKKCSCRPRSL